MPQETVQLTPADVVSPRKERKSASLMRGCNAQLIGNKVWHIPSALICYDAECLKKSHLESKIKRLEADEREHYPLKCSHCDKSVVNPKMDELCARAQQLLRKQGKNLVCEPIVLKGCQTMHACYCSMNKMDHPCDFLLCSQCNTNCIQDCKTAMVAAGMPHQSPSKHRRAVSKRSNVMVGEVEKNGVIGVESPKRRRRTR